MKKKLQITKWVAKLKQLTDTQLFTLLEQTNYQQNVARILTLIADNLGYKAAYNFVTRLRLKK